MTQVTQLIIAPSSDRQISNLIRGIVDIATKRPANAETLKLIHTLAAEAIAMMDSRQQPGKGQKRGGF